MTMKKYDVVARFADFANGEEVGCGSIEAESALDAIKMMLEDRPADLVDALEFTAINRDDEYSATVYFYEDGSREVHLCYDDGRDEVVEL